MDHRYLFYFWRINHGYMIATNSTQNNTLLHKKPIMKSIICAKLIKSKSSVVTHFSCLNIWDEVWWFLSLRVFELLSSSSLLFPQRFGWYILRTSSGVCRTREPSWNFKLRPLLNPRGSPLLIPLAITWYMC